MERYAGQQARPAKRPDLEWCLGGRRTVLDRAELDLVRALLALAVADPKPVARQLARPEAEVADAARTLQEFLAGAPREGRR
jgi:hypothetical protein